MIVLVTIYQLFSATLTLEAEQGKATTNNSFWRMAKVSCDWHQPFQAISGCHHQKSGALTSSKSLLDESYDKAKLN